MSAPRSPESKLAVVGAGNMAEALVGGFLKAGLVTLESLRVADPDPQRRARFRDQLGLDVLSDNRAAVQGARTVLLAVKPQVVPQVAAEIGPALGADALVVSIAAGISTARLEALLPAATRVVRVMPNLPALVGAGVSAYCRGARATADNVQWVDALLCAVGTAVPVAEARMDAVTALSGSGPAYVFYLAECLVQAGLALGFDPAMARKLTLDTIRGTARLLEDGGPDPAEWRRRVTSPGGTTAAALAVLEAAGMPAVWTAALRAAAERARELSAPPA